MGFRTEADAVKAMKALQERMEAYGLGLHADKTRLIEVKRPRKSEFKPPKGKSFDFLGFRHYWCRSRKGTWVLKRKTAPDRLSRSLVEMNDWCRRNRHVKVGEQIAQMKQKLNGHYGYYGVIGNSRSVHCYYHYTIRLWHKWLKRRDRTRRFCTIAEFYTKAREVYQMPQPKIVHFKI